MVALNSRKFMQKGKTENIMNSINLFLNQSEIRLIQSDNGSFDKFTLFNLRASGKLIIKNVSLTVNINLWVFLLAR